MELLGTEVQPDWHVWEGSFEEGVTWESRATNAMEAKINFASAGEVQRAAQHASDPDQRFHYRYQAAVLAWEAAKLMTNHCDDTAFVLWTAGSWLKNRDPETADIFYKALVRRCRNTALGAEADYLHWFPTLDSAGRLLPRERPMISEFFNQPAEEELPQLEAEENSLIAEAEASDPIPEPEITETEIEVPAPNVEHGFEYTVEPGDTIYAIVRAFNHAGVNISVDDVLAANPGLVPNKMATGTTLTIPAEPLTKFIE
jgi:hypothetical protein